MDFVEVELERKVYNADEKKYVSTGKDVYQFRLTSANAAELERKAGKSIIEFLKEFSMNNVITLIRYMLKWNNAGISTDRAYEVYDQLVLNGYDLERIQTDIITKTLVVSGFFPKETVEEALSEAKNR